MEDYRHPTSLRQAVKQTGLGLKSLSALTDIPVDKLRGYLSHKETPTLAEMQEISSAINFDVTHFFPEVRYSNNREDAQGTQKDRYVAFAGYLERRGYKFPPINGTTPKDLHNLKNSLKVLPPLERDMIERGFGFGDHSPQKPDEIAAHYRMLPEDVARIQETAISRLIVHMNKL